MGRFSRDEIEEAFAEYQRRAAHAGATGDWDQWVDQFTPDVTYREHHYGTFDGREAVREWISETMTAPPFDEMTEFPIEWHVIDEDKGWVICWVWNRFADLGDGEVHQEGNVTILHYAGDGQWSYEEDVYNPAAFGTMVQRYLEARASR
jgi:hypothetical protein